MIEITKLKEGTGHGHNDQNHLKQTECYCNDQNHLNHMGCNRHDQNHLKHMGHGCHDQNHLKQMGCDRRSKSPKIDGTRSP